MCTQYWPRTSNEQVAFGPFMVEVQVEKTIEDYVQRELKLTLAVVRTFSFYKKKIGLHMLGSKHNVAEVMGKV